MRSTKKVLTSQQIHQVNKVFVTEKFYQLKLKSMLVTFDIYFGKMHLTIKP
jgi:hypothetical protein